MALKYTIVHAVAIFFHELRSFVSQQLWLIDSIHYLVNLLYYVLFVYFFSVLQDSINGLLQFFLLPLLFLLYSIIFLFHVFLSLRLKSL